MSNPENDALLNLQPVIVARPNASQGYIDQTADAADQAARQALDMLSDTADTRDNGAVLPPLVIVDQGIPQEGCLSSEKLHQLSEEAQRSTPPHEKPPLL